MVYVKVQVHCDHGANCCPVHTDEDIHRHLGGHFRRPVSQVSLTVRGAQLVGLAQGFVTGRPDGFLFELFPHGDDWLKIVQNSFRSREDRLITSEDSYKLEGSIGGGGSGRFQASIVPTQVGADLDHVPLLRLVARSVEITRRPTLDVRAPMIEAWVLEHPVPTFLRPSVLVYQAGPLQGQSSFSRDHYAYEVNGFEVLLHRVGPARGVCRVQSRIEENWPRLEEALTAVGYALSVLWGYPVERVAVQRAGDGEILLRLRPHSKAGSVWQLVPPNGEESLLRLATEFLLREDNNLVRRLVSVLYPVLSTSDHEQAFRMALACEGLARVIWTSRLCRSRRKYKMKTHLPHVLETVSMPSDDEELQAWRSFRDGTVHDDDQLYEFTPAKHLHHRFLINSLFDKLLLGLVGYTGERVSHARVARSLYPEGPVTTAPTQGHKRKGPRSPFM